MDDRMHLTCCPVRRTESTVVYSAGCYEVCLRRVEDGGHAIISTEVPRQPAQFSKLILDMLRRQYDIIGCAATPLTMVGGVPPAADQPSLLNVFFVVSTPTDCSNVSSEVEFVKLSKLLKSPGTLRENREMLLLVDQWLRERHSLSTVNVDLLFPAAEATQVTPGGSIVREIISNPLHQANVRPPEDTLVVAINNPMFPSTN